MKNKKGFTLVELLAVIVILALIMSIAVVSIGGVLQGTRQSTFRESAAGIIDGVRQQLLLHNSLTAGDYFFRKGILEKGGDESPLGGKIAYFGDDGVTTPNNITTSPVGDLILKKTGGTLTCGAAIPSFVTVTLGNNNVYEYKICLSTQKTGSTTNYYIKNATETQLLTNKDQNTWLVNS